MVPGPLDRWQRIEGFDKFSGILSGGASGSRRHQPDRTTFGDAAAAEEEVNHTPFIRGVPL